jgi:hypothetical protein
MAKDQKNTPPEGQIDIAEDLVDAVDELPNLHFDLEGNLIKGEPKSDPKK